MFVADAHHDNGQPFVLQADEKRTAFQEVESAIPRLSIGQHYH